MDKEREESMILLVVDTQKQIVKRELYQFELFVYRVRELIKTARANNVEVIYVRHDGGEGSEMTKGTEGFEIYDEFKPLEGEKIFDKKYNSAFRGTGLLEYLKDKGEDTIMLVGLLTDYCIDATVKAGFEHGFKMLVPSKANSTFDNDFMSAEKTYNYYYETMWKNVYADATSFRDSLAILKNKPIGE